MKEADRLTVARKAELAVKYAHLNEMLKQISDINSEISDLSAQINKLHTKKNNIEHKFNQEVIKVEPTEICTLKKKTTISKTQRDKLMEAAKNDPAILEQVSKLLNVDYVVV